MNIIPQHIDINKYTRTGWKRNETKAIVLHWTATPGASAQGVRNWFDSQVDRTNPSFASAQYVVGLDGEVLELMPSNEYARHVGSKTYTVLGKELMKGLHRMYKSPSWTCIGVELCHEDKSGKFNDATLSSAATLVAYLLDIYNLERDAIITHKAVVGWKDCPKWFVEHPEDLLCFIEEVELYRKRKETKI